MFHAGPVFTPVYGCYYQVRIYRIAGKRLCGCVNALYSFPSMEMNKEKIDIGMDATDNI
jgi:hypothetical protein